MNTTTQILEGQRAEPTILNKMDTSIEHAQKKHTDNSFLSPCSTSSEVPNSDRGCHHNKLVSHENYDNCFHCGAYVSKTGSRTFKSKKMSYVAFFPPKTIYQTMTKRSSLFKQSLNPEYSHIRQTYVEWVLELADKLKISSNSSHLAILLLDTIMYKDASLTSRLQLYAPVCLLIAAKTMELDERIPFIPKLRRYANPTFSVDDYRRAELLVLDMVDWNAQFSTALEINEFLMCQGVLFSTDEIENTNVLLEKGKASPEGLRENTQHGNTYHLESKTDEKKDAASKEQEKTLSPGSKENNENCENPIPAAEVNPQQADQQDEGVLPAAKQVPVFLKQHSTPASFETNRTRAVTPIDKKADEIMTHFETSYVKLATLLVKDVEFVEFEPRVVSASTMAFFRCVNKVTPLWNGELETITNLKFPQISSCFDLIYKKYNTAFSHNTAKVLTVLNTPDNLKDLSVYKVVRTNSLSTEKSTLSYTRTELSNKSNIINTSYSNRSSVGNESSLTDQKPFERKSIFAYQPKTSIPVANPTTASSYNYMRDDLRFRTKYSNGTINTEIPQRNMARIPANYPAARFNVNHEYSTNYYNNNSFSTMAGTSYPAAIGSHVSVLDSSYVRNEVYTSRNPSISYLTHKSDVSFENGMSSYQARLSMLKK